MSEASRVVLEENGSTILQYGPSAGLASFREWISEWQGVALNQVLIGNGSLEMIEFITRELTKPGDVVLTESPSYDRAITIFRRNGAELVGIPLDPDGPDLDRLESVAKKRQPKFFYTIPDFQNPSGATYSLANRKSLIQLAARYGFRIIEDAPYRYLRYRGEKSLRSFLLRPIS